MMSAARSAAWPTSVERWPGGVARSGSATAIAPKSSPPGAQRDGQRAVVELDRAAPVGERVAQPAAGGLGRPALGVGDDGAAGVDHAHGRAAGVEDLVQPAAQLLDDIVEHHRVEAVGDRRHRARGARRAPRPRRARRARRPPARAPPSAARRARRSSTWTSSERASPCASRTGARDHPDRDLGRAGAGGAARRCRARRPPAPARTARSAPRGRPDGTARRGRRPRGSRRRAARRAPGSTRTTRPSASTSTTPVGEDSHARRRSSSARSRPRRWRSSSANTATFDRSTTGSNGLRT